MAAQTSSDGPPAGFVVLSKRSNTVSPDADAFLSAAKSLEGSIAHLAAAFKALTATLKSDPTLNITKESKAILDVLDCALTIRKRLQGSSLQSEKEISKMTKPITTLQADIASLMATEPVAATSVPTIPTNASLKVKNAFAEAKSSLEAHNARARAKNELVVSMDGMLEPLLDENGEQVAAFPGSGSQLSCLGYSELLALLTAFGLPSKKGRFMNLEQFCFYIGAFYLAPRLKACPVPFW